MQLYKSAEYPMLHLKQIYYFQLVTDSPKKTPSKMMEKNMLGNNLKHFIPNQ